MVQTLDFHEQQARLYVKTALKSLMPEGNRFAPSELTTDAGVLAFRDFVL